MKIFVIRMRMGENRWRDADVPSFLSEAGAEAFLIEWMEQIPKDGPVRVFEIRPYFVSEPPKKILP